MNKKENAFMNDKLQKAALKLISEEYFAYQLYVMARMAVTKDNAYVIDEKFQEIAEDELTDHMKSMIQWCRQYNYEIPCSDIEFRKYSDKKLVKLVRDMKKNMDAGYYIDVAIKSEELAIASYKIVLDMSDVCQFTDLQYILWNIYYDEQKHLQTLNTMKIAYDAEKNIEIY